ncbi:hypothetical protein HOC_13274 [Hyphomonas oceanitis SCH89]|uniref:Uncharacterized protein n=1 Tax=Hyphomonas oceanitis SCH89 TaxID=1280953 RepID=A0A059G5R3_9PROT|nr:hypothetical protein HOC_13274 [Hyphomonas oceanitis SCH89]
MLNHAAGFQPFQRFQAYILIVPSSNISLAEADRITEPEIAVTSTRKDTGFSLASMKGETLPAYTASSR